MKTLNAILLIFYFHWFLISTPRIFDQILEDSDFWQQKYFFNKLQGIYQINLFIIIKQSSRGTESKFSSG